MPKTVLFSLIIVFSASALFLAIKKEPLVKEALFGGFRQDFHQSGFFELRKQMMRDLKKNDYKNHEDRFVQIGVASHHLPTASPFIADFYKALSDFGGPRKIFVILGPDHFEKCLARISTTLQNYQTPFGDLTSEREIINKLLDAGVGLDDKCFDGEHSIGVQTIFIKYLFPEAKIVPLLFSSSADGAFIDKIVEVLSVYQNDIAVVASVDFSHHRDYDTALRLDAASEEKIKNLEEDAFSLDCVDSPPSIKTAILLAKKFDHQKPIIAGRANSYDFDGRADDTTGYINAFFAK